MVIRLEIPSDGCVAQTCSLDVEVEVEATLKGDRLNKLLDLDKFDYPAAAIGDRVLRTRLPCVTLSGPNLGLDYRAIGVQHVHDSVSQGYNNVLEFVQVAWDFIVRCNGPLRNPECPIVDLLFTDCHKCFLPGGGSDVFLNGVSIFRGIVARNQVKRRQWFEKQHNGEEEAAA